MKFSLPYDQNVKIIPISTVSQKHIKKIFLLSFCFDLLNCNRGSKSKKNPETHDSTKLVLI